MNDFLKMDIFFVVTTIATLLITVLLVAVLIRVLRILKNVEDISELVEEEGKQLRQDLAGIRKNVRDEGLRVKHFLELIGLGAPKRKRTKKS